MRLGRVKLAGVSVALAVLQLALVSTVAAKYLYERWTCPRVWTRTVANDAKLAMRGRYLGLHLTVNGCQSTLPSAKLAEFPRDYNGAVKKGDYAMRAGDAWAFDARLKVEGNILFAVRPEGSEETTGSVPVLTAPGEPCDQMRLQRAVDFYIPESAQGPLPLKQGQELWVEVTVPKKGAPRQLQLAVKEENGAWKPLAFE
jgi:hypothetical protein